MESPEFGQFDGSRSLSSVTEGMTLQLQVYGRLSYTGFSCGVQA